MKTDYDAQISDIEGKIHNITGIAITATLTAFVDEIPNIDLVKKTN